MNLQNLFFLPLLFCIVMNCNGQSKDSQKTTKQKREKAATTEQISSEKPPSQKANATQHVAINKHKIEYINLNKSTYFIDKVEFKDEDGNILSTFDVEANNPFNKYDLPSDRTNTLGGKIYNLKDVPAKRFEQFLRNTNASSSRSAQTDRDIEFVSAESQTIIYQKNPNHALVAYNLFLYDGIGETYESQSEIILLDKNGKEIQKLRLPHIARVPLISKDGKFLFANYGGAYNCTEFEYLEKGFNVYNVVTGESIYEESREGMRNLHPTVLHNMIGFSVILAGRKRLYKMYDFKNRILYERTFTASELGFSKFIEEGIRLKNKSGEFQVLTYVEDFKKTPIILKK